MSCPRTTEFLEQAIDSEGPIAQQHLASCPDCREAVESERQLRRLLAGLPSVATPSYYTDAVLALSDAVAGRSFTCDETLAHLDAWQAGCLTKADAFLVEDHVLQCASCAEASAQAEQLATVLRALPELSVPASVAERIAAARIPWWQRLLPAPLPRRGMSIAMAFGSLAVTLTLTCLLLTHAGVNPPDDRHAAQVSRAMVAPVPCAPRRAATPAESPATVSEPATNTSAEFPLVSAPPRHRHAWAIAMSPRESAREREPQLSSVLSGSPRTSPAHFSVRRAAPAVSTTVEPETYFHTASVHQAVMNLAQDTQLEHDEESQATLQDAVLLAMSPHHAPTTATNSVPVDRPAGHQQDSLFYPEGERQQSFSQPSL